MDTFSHNINTLFDQLGLPSSAGEIDQFIHQHSPLSKELALHQAAFWTPSQARFIREAIEEDSDWAEAVDDLNTRMH